MSGNCVNEQGDAGKEVVMGAYGAVKYNRLEKLKSRFDKNNLFRLNQNIEPSSPGTRSRRQSQIIAKAGIAHSRGAHKFPSNAETNLPGSGSDPFNLREHNSQSAVALVCRGPLGR